MSEAAAPDGSAPLAARTQPLESILAFHTPEGWGHAVQASGLTADRMAKIVTEIATSSKNDNARLAACKFMDDKNRDILRMAKILRITKGREVLTLPEQVIDGKVVSGQRITDTEEHDLVLDSVRRTEEKLAEVTAGTLLPEVEDPDDPDDFELED